ncbi:hypothetical protein M3Y95_00622300 [Aphelenchoides besseyi]|nr:hypothetical protein M3Y95_00622300 [Aphelenchoides besseyi]
MQSMQPKMQLVFVFSLPVQMNPNGGGLISSSGSKKPKTDNTTERRKETSSTPATSSATPSAASSNRSTPSKTPNKTPSRNSPVHVEGVISSSRRRSRKLKTKARRPKRNQATISVNTTEEVDVSPDRHSSIQPKNEVERQLEAAFGYPIPPSYYEVKTITFPKVKKLGTRMARSCMILKDTEESGSQLRFGDVVLSINEKLVHSKKNFSQQFRDVIEEPKTTKVVIKLARVKTLIPAPPSRIPPAYEVLSGYTYHVACVYRIPTIRIALSVKSYNEKVYVTKVREETSAWMSLKQGDALIDLNGEQIANITELEQGVKKLLSNNFVTMLVERPEDSHASQFVRMVLSAERSVFQDCGLAKDVHEICQREKRRMLTEIEKRPLIPILRSSRSPNPTEVTCESPPTPLRLIRFSKESEDVPIACEANPKLLAPVPSRSMPNFSLNAYQPTPKSNSPANKTRELNSPKVNQGKRKKRKRTEELSMDTTQENDATKDDPPE